MNDAIATASSKLSSLLITSDHSGSKIEELPIAAMTTTLQIEPLLAALFDLPCNLRIVQPNYSKDTIDNPSSLHETRQPGLLRPALPRNKYSTSSTSSWRSHDLTIPRRSFGHDDEGGETDNTSLLHGENISLTDEEFSDAAAHFYSDGRASAARAAPLGARFPLPMQFPPFAAMFGAKSNSNAGSGVGGHEQLTDPPRIRKGVTMPPFSEETAFSPNKKKKKRQRKNNVGRRSSSKTKGHGLSVLPMSPSMEDEDSAEISPVGDVKEDLTSYLFQNGRVDENESFYRLTTLQSKISHIRATIRSLESDLIETRHELAVANQHLHAATMELGMMQRTALEVEIGMGKLTQQQDMSVSSSSVFMTPLQGSCVDGSDVESSTKNLRGSISSVSSDKLNYFTPTSSIVGSGEESDLSACYTPRSANSSRASFYSDNDISPGDEMDRDTTPLTKNAMRRKLDSELHTESVSPIGTPSTAASTQEEANGGQGSDLMMPDIEGNENHQGSGCESKGRRVTFSRQQSFIRAHDLVINGCNQSPLLPLHGKGITDVINALFEKGLEFAMDESDRWIPVRDTEKILSKRAKQIASGTFDQGPMGTWPNAAAGKDVFVWYSPCPHDGHGSEYPVVKARGLIPTTALSIVQLLLDSERVKQYNKMSLGRHDEHCFATGVERADKCPRTGIHGEAKIVRSKSQPPLARKPIELRILLHARRLTPEEEEERSGGARYLTIARSVWETEEGTTDGEDSTSTRCEMLLGVNLIRELAVPQASNGEAWCELTTITHAVSPGIPLAIGKRVGLAAAGKYISDIRCVFE